MAGRRLGPALRFSRQDGDGEERRRLVTTRKMMQGTQAQKKLLSQQSDEIMALQNELYVSWISNSLPMAWDKLDVSDPVEPHKTKVTLRLDDDMLKWFRKMGPGYQARINQVLRLYWRGVRLGQVETHYDPSVYARMVADHKQRG